MVRTSRNQKRQPQEYPRNLYPKNQRTTNG
ncbi:Uncharacterized protein BM_BM1030 [Brugia malayi]|uniref:Bm1030 n=1 Tax=Brugia malayi TaxID=6279 RepID=A0A4E9FHH1_BRUMA|nr:Uncharacterized protein BM_BM1030 [Brugia malayi]VIO96367.1 Uncharacterized protein BM_BM1030 [Brugia malayi]